jgi:hypothetical protein
MAFGG